MATLHVSNLSDGTNTVGTSLKSNDSSLFSTIKRKTSLDELDQGFVTSITQMRTGLNPESFFVINSSDFLSTSAFTGLTASKAYEFSDHVEVEIDDNNGATTAKGWARLNTSHQLLGVEIYERGKGFSNNRTLTITQAGAGSGEYTMTSTTAMLYPGRVKDVLDLLSGIVGEARKDTDNSFDTAKFGVVTRDTKKAAPQQVATFAIEKVIKNFHTTSQNAKHNFITQPKPQRYGGEAVVINLTTDGSGVPNAAAPKSSSEGSGYLVGDLILVEEKLGHGTGPTEVTPGNQGSCIVKVTGVA